jgi:hypothetical protein
MVYCLLVVRPVYVATGSMTLQAGEESRLRFYSDSVQLKYVVK